MMQNSEFYIGWMAKAPAGFSKHVKKVLLILFPVALALALLLASFQKKFATSVFEFGKLTAIKGVYFDKPFPRLKVVAGKDVLGNLSYITIPLVGYGKHGAETAIKELEEEKKIFFNNKEITLKGTLIYSDGKTWLQVDKNDKPVISIGSEAFENLKPVQKELGYKVIKGEIIDPKCYFGVMKPGEGKVHKDCAIRCISGGIPPVLKVQNEKGETNYYFIVGPNGEKMNEAVQDFVGEPVAIKASVVQQDDWIVLYVKDKNQIETISKRQLLRPGLEVLACATACSQ